jgi:D-serine deaminase-like pyridoxal phosphate-dependent protein
MPLALQRRAEVVAALQADGHELQVVNGGGTGSVAFTSADPSVTEITVGSGYLCPHLFSGYSGMSLQPAGFFAIRVVRTSDSDHVTCQGGGYIASGAAGADRLPIVHLPHGLSPISLEGFGEVQTPLKISGSSRPALGDPIICRHAKAGELAERFNNFVFVRGGKIVDRQPTYRGLGWSFF